MSRAFLRDLVIDEVAFCQRGMNPESDMLLYKARRDSGRGKLRKDEHDEPGTFSDHFEDGRAMEIDAALDERLYALLRTTTEIMRAPDVDREALVLEAVNAYAAAMNQDVPELFAGRLAKMLQAFGGSDALQDDPEVWGVVKRELEVAGLTDDDTKGETMDWLTKLTKEERAALDFALAGTDPTEFFKGTSEEAGVFVAKLVTRAVKATQVEGELVTTGVELVKLRAETGTDEGIDAIVKSIVDPGVRSLVEIQRRTIRKQGDDMAAFQKASRRREIRDIAKCLDCIPNEGDALTDALEKADAAGILEPIQKALTTANAQAKVGKAFSEMGVDTITGEGATGTPVEAEEALMAKAIEIQKAEPTLTTEQAQVMAYEQNPTLYAQTRTPARQLQ